MKMKTILWFVFAIIIIIVMTNAMYSYRKTKEELVNETKKDIVFKSLLLKEELMKQIEVLTKAKSFYDIDKRELAMEYIKEYTTNKLIADNRETFIIFWDDWYISNKDNDYRDMYLRTVLLSNTNNITTLSKIRFQDIDYLGASFNISGINIVGYYGLEIIEFDAYLRDVLMTFMVSTSITIFFILLFIAIPTAYNRKLIRIIKRIDNITNQKMLDVDTYIEKYKNSSIIDEIDEVERNFEILVYKLKTYYDRMSVFIYDNLLDRYNIRLVNMKLKEVFNIDTNILFEPDQRDESDKKPVLFFIMDIINRNDIIVNYNEVTYKYIEEKIHSYIIRFLTNDDMLIRKINNQFSVYYRDHITDTSVAVNHVNSIRDGIKSLIKEISNLSEDDRFFKSFFYDLPDSLYVSQFVQIIKTLEIRYIISKSKNIKIKDDDLLCDDGYFVEFDNLRKHNNDNKDDEVYILHQSDDGGTDDDIRKK